MNTCKFCTGEHCFDPKHTSSFSSKLVTIAMLKLPFVSSIWKQTLKTWKHFQSESKISSYYLCWWKGLPTPAPPCVDKIPNCNQYSKEACTSSSYRAWAEDNCRAHCNFCTPSGGQGRRDLIPIFSTSAETIERKWNLWSKTPEFPLCFWKRRV